MLHQLAAHAHRQIFSGLTEEANRSVARFGTLQYACSKRRAA